MHWNDERGKDEFSWLALVSRLKYDGYRGYIPGVRFLESLTYWLQQFPVGQREAAYEFMRTKLIYVCPEELQHLVELTYYNTVEPVLVKKVAAQLGVAPHEVWGSDAAHKSFNRALRQSLFFGLSDGARIDSFRRANEGTISNDQVAANTEISSVKWDSMVKDLRRDPAVADDTAKFESIFLIDDLVASGTTLLRPGQSEGTWDGKLCKFLGTLESQVGGAVAPTFHTVVHHYIASHRASQQIAQRSDMARSGTAAWYPSIEFTFGTVLSEDCHHSAASVGPFAPLIDLHYNPSIETSSIKLGGTDAKYGFAAGGLALVLEHNTPNNSIGLIWAETSEKAGDPRMRPLFRRRQRHL
jgi:hypothetical protein